MAKKIDIADLVIGDKYNIIADNVPFENLVYCGLVGRCGRPLFTTGTIDSWEQSLNISTAKSNLRVYPLSHKVI